MLLLSHLPSFNEKHCILLSFFFSHDGKFCWHQHESILCYHSSFVAIIMNASHKLARAHLHNHAHMHEHIRGSEREMKVQNQSRERCTEEEIRTARKEWHSRLGISTEDFLSVSCLPSALSVYRRRDGFTQL